MLNTGDKLIGLVAQTMGGPKGSGAAYPGKYRGVVTYNTAGTVVYTAPYDMTAIVYLWGGGGAGDHLGPGVGGCGGGADRWKWFLRAGQQLTITIAPQALASGAPGGDTIVTGPDGKVVRATGGMQGVTNTAVPGTGIGGESPRTGGVGGSPSIGRAPASGQNGGGPGADAAGGGGGGGAAGFNDEAPDLMQPANASGTGGGGGVSNGAGNSGFTPGGGGGGGGGVAAGGPGGIGQVKIVQLQVAP